MFNLEFWKINRIANVNWAPDPPTAGAIINIDYSVGNLSMPTTHLVYVVAAVVRDDRNTDPTVSNKVKVDRGVTDISVSTSLKWPSDKTKYSLVVFLLDYKYGIYDCVRFSGRSLKKH
ncbi:31699_t:CDS:2 [Gigaspora margarita]|uniref:31699_t:CDS:1 n=1 Tax=Gigaspora margarita TaxID=4874 RepID=A0ABN7UKW4_GIGMA|nr:31699_t:CDS:2 [Gigaspora margarita]